MSFDHKALIFWYLVIFGSIGVAAQLHWSYWAIYAGFAVYIATCDM